MSWRGRVDLAVTNGGVLRDQPLHKRTLVPSRVEPSLVRLEMVPFLSLTLHMVARRLSLEVVVEEYFHL
jgi:hypothetical protein